LDDIVIAGEHADMKAFFDGISEKSKRLRNTTTPKNKILKRQGKAGKKWKYIRRIDAMEWLDNNYPGWSFEMIPDSIMEKAGYMWVTGKLTIYETGQAALKRVITCIGCDEIEFKTETVDGQKFKLDEVLVIPYFKNAETDALKRCVFSLGGFKDVYTDDKIEAQSYLSPEDQQWYVDRVLQRVIDKPDILFKSMVAFYNGIVDRKYIEDNLLKGK